METSSTTEQLQKLLPKLFSGDRATGERYLLFRVTSELKAAISLDQVWEATTLPATAVTPIPQMPEWVLGWSNGRDRVYCVLSLDELLGLAQVSKIPQEYTVIVVQWQQEARSSLLGLAVHSIIRTVGINPDDIVSPVGEFPSELTPYLRGSLQQDESAIAVLDLDQIVKEIGQSPQQS
jgi:twitching motility protein PilI